MEQNKPDNKETPEEKKRRTNREIYYALGLVTRLGITITLIAGIFLYAGLYLDRMFGGHYLILAVFLLLSIVVSIYAIYVLLEPIIGPEKRKNFLRRKKK
jgi:uncharacterized membrane protein